MILLIIFLVSVRLSLPEPPIGKLYFAAWLDTEDSLPGANDGDRPIKFNQRLGFNSSSFQYAQNLPVDTFTFPIEQIEDLNTDTFVFLTIYPRPNPWNISTSDITALAEQCSKLNSQGRRVLLRFAPEFNGNWNAWGQQPTEFLTLWKRVWTEVKRLAPETSFMWAPSSGNGYPYGEPNPNTADYALLDTNNDGFVDNQDDPYLSFYPGDEYVDWVGMSVYHYGSSWPWQDNVRPNAEKFETFINGGGFYKTYTQDKRKPFGIAETAATFHTEMPRGDGELSIKQTWWRQYLTNQTFLESYPMIKLICIFEFQKFEELTNRDFRITNNTQILESFLRDFSNVKTFYLLANSTGSIESNLGTPSSSCNQISYQWATVLLILIFSL
jgi:hypothetical protein